MDIIRTSIGISKAFKNIARLKEIVSIFARNGFDEFITLGITAKIPNFVLPKSKVKLREEFERSETYSWVQVVGYRLRKSFEELGPAFIKFGQLLASREDLFDQAFIIEMQKLRDKVKGIPFSETEKVLNKSLNKDWREVFESIEHNPIGTASIGVAYKGVLKNGDNVVIKIRRPGIDKLISTDFSIMIFLVSQVEKASKEIRYLGISRILNDFAVSLQNELNFNVEALNCEKFGENLKKKKNSEIFHIPKVYKEISSEEVLVIELMDGIPFSDVENISPHKEKLTEKLTVGVQLFMKSILQDGFFHADLHGGNFFLLKNNSIGIIDYGLMGHLGRKSRQNFIAIVYALITFNYENLIYEFLDVADYDEIPDIEDLISDVKDALSPFMGLTVQQTNYTEVFQAIMNTLNKHKLYLPRDWFIVFRALITIDGVGKSLGIDFDIFGILEDDIQDILKESFRKEDLLEELAWASRDILPTLRVLPRHLKWFVKDWSRKNYAFEIQNKGYEKELKVISGSIFFLGFSLLASIFIAGGVILISGVKITNWSQIPILTWVFWGMGVFTLIRGSFYLSK